MTSLQEEYDKEQSIQECYYENSQILESGLFFADSREIRVVATRPSKVWAINFGSTITIQGFVWSILEEVEIDSDQVLEFIVNQITLNRQVIVTVRGLLRSLIITTAEGVLIEHGRRGNSRDVKIIKPEQEEEGFRIRLGPLDVGESRADWAD
jgi:hypothetical protein